MWREKRREKKYTEHIYKCWRQAKIRWILFLSSHKHSDVLLNGRRSFEFKRLWNMIWNLKRAIQSVSRGAKWNENKQNNDMCNVRVDRAGAKPKLSEMNLFRAELLFFLKCAHFSNNICVLESVIAVCCRFVSRFYFFLFFSRALQKRWRVFILWTNEIYFEKKTALRKKKHYARIGTLVLRSRIL